jgi:hypothetical protein
MSLSLAAVVKEKHEQSIQFINNDFKNQDLSEKMTDNVIDFYIKHMKIIKDMINKINEQFTNPAQLIVMSKVLNQVDAALYPGEKIKNLIEKSHEINENTQELRKKIKQALKNAHQCEDIMVFLSNQRSKEYDSHKHYYDCLFEDLVGKYQISSKKLSDGSWLNENWIDDRWVSLRDAPEELVNESWVFGKINPIIFQKKNQSQCFDEEFYQLKHKNYEQTKEMIRIYEELDILTQDMIKKICNILRESLVELQKLENM